MIKIKVITSNTRGFLKNIFQYPFENIEFDYDKSKVYEIPGKLRMFIAKAVKFKIFDYFGVFQIIKSNKIDADMLFSYNRFLDGDKPYIIYLENPSALVNYCWDRPKYYITRKKLKKCFSDKNLYAIVCMSKTCYKNIGNLYDIPYSVKIIQNYPLIQDDRLFNSNDVEIKTQKKIIECLFISSDFELKGGRDIIEMLKKINNNVISSIHLNVITRKETIRQEDLLYIEQLKNVSLLEFNLNKKQLDEYYKKSCILLNPTRFDSFNLVTLEAIKYGCAVLATDMYALKEMVIDGYNGYITSPMYPLWDKDGSINREIYTNMKQTICSGQIDEKLVCWMTDKINKMVLDRNLLKNMCVNSLTLARNEEFSEENIKNKWEVLLKEIKEKY